MKSLVSPAMETKNKNFLLAKSAMITNTLLISENAYQGFDDLFVLAAFSGNNHLGNRIGGRQ